MHGEHSGTVRTMRTLEEIRAIILQHQSELRERYGVTMSGLFGSYVRGNSALTATWTYW